MRPWGVVLDAADARGGRLRELPAGPGVALFEDGDGRATLLAATGNVRTFVGDRLARDEGSHDARIGAVRTVSAVGLGSMFEGDLVWLEAARERLPATYRAAADLWRAWCVGLDPEAATPVWRKVELRQAAEGVASGFGPTTLIGPVADKHAAKRLGEGLDDVFELCQFPAELAKAPDGCACAYKEMGRCPAACDGSEPMSDYRARAREALGFADDPARTAGAIEAEMAAAAAGADFERAGVLRDKFARIEKLHKGGLRHAGSLGRFALGLVLPGERRGWARIGVFAGGEVRWVADVRADGANDAWGWAEGVFAEAAGTAFELHAASADRLGLICHHWFMPERRGRRRRFAVLDLRKGATRRGFASAVRAAAEPGTGKPSEGTDEDWHDRELGA